MAASIKFDNTEIRDLTHVPRFVKHESVADRQIITLPLAREDGEVLISSKFGIKKVLLQGILTGTTQAILEAAMDTFKELFSRPEKNLDIDWNAATMRFVATCSKGIEFDRDHFHLLFVPWIAEFTVLTGAGVDTAETVARNDEVITITTPGTDAFTLAGSKPAKVRITLTGTNWPSTIKGIEYKNVDTGEKIVVTRNKNWGTTDKVIIDTILKRVTENLASALYKEGPFYGMFPQFKIGTNNILITAGGVVNQETSENGDFSYVSTGHNIQSDANDKISQSFSVPYADDTFKGITMLISKTGSPGTLTWRIETDNAGKPSGSLVTANATGTMAGGDITIYTVYQTDYSANLWGLVAGTKYWLVISGVSLDGSNHYTWWEIPNEPFIYKQYQRGNLMVTFDGGATWTPGTPSTTCLGFKIRYGGEPSAGSVKHKVEYTKTYL